MFYSKGPETGFSMFKAFRSVDEEMDAIAYYYKFLLPFVLNDTSFLIESDCGKTNFYFFSSLH